MANLFEQGKAVAQPLTGEAQSIKDKSDMMDQYKSATAPATPRQEAKHEASPADRVKPGAKYGDRAGEQRIDTSGWSNPAIKSYHTGTDYVPKTGPAILEKGEAVVPKEKNMKNVTDKMKASLSGDDKPKKEIKEMHVRKSANGKHIVKHVHHHSSHPDEEHVMDSMADLHDHLEQHAGSPSQGEQPTPAADGQEPPAQMTAAPSAPPAGAAPTPGV